MSNVFFISDTHFYHANILKFTSKFGEPLRNFYDVAHMNEYMVKCWNSVVGKRDLVFHLGDVVVKWGDSYTDVLDRLNGRKILIAGNHDKHDTQVYLKSFERVEGMWTYKDGIILTHCPIHPSQLEYRFKLNVHGHVHKNSLDDKRYYNVSVEAIDYTPVSLDTIREYMKNVGL